MARLLFLISLVTVSSIAVAGKGPTLIGGTPVKPGEYPEVVYIDVGNAVCSAAVVGKRAVLTAAHCARNGRKITFQIGQTQFAGVCDAPEAYPDDDHDISLCLIDSDLPLPYATVAQKGPEVGDKITLIGYGCVKPGGGGGNDGVLRVGQSTVTGFTDWDFVTKKESALCFGDSGGPAFRKIADPKAEHHYILGVNSKGDIRSTSYLSMTYTLASTGFMDMWTKRTGASVCGINVKCDEPPTPKLCGDSWGKFASPFVDYVAAVKELDVCMFKRTLSTCGQEVGNISKNRDTLDNAFLKLTDCLNIVE